MTAPLPSALKASENKPSRASVWRSFDESVHFRDAPEEMREAFFQELSWNAIDGGTVLVHRGDTAHHVFYVLHGRFRVLGAEDETIEDLGVGDLVGDSELVGDRVHSAQVVAVRDTEVGAIPLDAFVRIADRWPMFWKLHAQSLLRHVAHEEGTSVWRSTSRTIAIMFVDPTGPNDAFARGLQAALSRYQSVAWVDGKEAPPLSATTWGEPERAAAVSLAEAEAAAAVLVLQTDPYPTPWTIRCIRNADEILVVSRASTLAEPGELERYLYDRPCHDGVSMELVLIQPDDCVLPSGTARLLAWRPLIQSVRHVKLQEAFLGRLARALTGNSVGVVLGGGGGRGNAHIGVFEALRELGVPIDSVGGTSAGGGMAAMIASGRDPERIAGDSKIAFVDMGPFDSWDVPYLSFMQRQAVDAPARWLYGETDIEDLWIPFFSVSCDLVHSEKVVHRRGRVWKAVRATTALPGILPPLFLRGQVLIDGGVVDNTPIGVMKHDHAGPTILVNVSPPESDLVDPDLIDLPTNRDVYLSILHPLLMVRKVPSMGALVVQTMCMSGAHAVSSKQADLFLEPPISGYGTVDMEPVEELSAIGYNTTMEAFESRRNDAAFLRKFGLDPATFPEKLPRKRVPYELQAGRRAARARRRALVQAALGAIAGAAAGVALPSLVAGIFIPHGGALGAAIFGGIPLGRWLTSLRHTKAVPA